MTTTKAMIAALAVVGCVLPSKSDVCSCNVVGYQNKGLSADYAFNLVVRTFKGVGVEAANMKLGDIKATEDWMVGQDEVKTLQSNGAVDQAYTYLNSEVATEFSCPVGWYLTADTMDESKYSHFADFCKNDDPLPLGNGLLALVGSSDTKLIFSGEVLNEDQPIALNADYAFNITGNISPVDMTLGDIVASDDWMVGQDELKTLEDNGAVKKAYTFLNSEIAAEFSCPVGWYFTEDTMDESKYSHFADFCQNDTSVAAGEAFIVLVGSSTTMITIPSAL